MAYRPNKPKGEVNADYIYGELLRIGQEFQALTAPIITLAVTHVAPEKPRDGMVVHADGVSWNPGGTGKGLYLYSSGTWVKL